MLPLKISLLLLCSHNNHLSGLVSRKLRIITGLISSAVLFRLATFAIMVKFSCRMLSCLHNKHAFTPIFIITVTQERLDLNSWAELPNIAPVYNCTFTLSPKTHPLRADGHQMEIKIKVTARKLRSFIFTGWLWNEGCYFTLAGHLFYLTECRRWTGPCLITRL